MSAFIYVFTCTVTGRDQIGSPILPASSGPGDDISVAYNISGQWTDALPQSTVASELLSRGELCVQARRWF